MVNPRDIAGERKKKCSIVAVNNLGKIGSPCLTRISIGISSETWLSTCALAVAPVKISSRIVI